MTYAYLRKTGLERSEALEKDLERLGQQGFVIPEPSGPGISYAKYLGETFREEYCSCAISRIFSEKLLEGRELEFFRWEGDVAELIKDVREKLNMFGEEISNTYLLDEEEEEKEEKFEMVEEEE
ncbi:putative inactive heme oxygenase 2, chloroplastic [Castanea sativa]|uniref:putative inactive heme oxygenase 2, chloroplastic n=1 Tax=Castanea sativa TaxID=21020 RepID=UPI003F654345